MNRQQQDGGGDSGATRPIHATAKLETGDSAVDTTAVVSYRVQELQNLLPHSPSAGASGNASEKKTREKRKTSKIVEYEATPKVLPYEKRPNQKARNDSNSNPIKGGWRPEEDAALSRMALSDVRMKWSHIARSPELRGRTGKQCRERWYNQLDPSIKKEPWSEEEDRILVEGVKEFGTSWIELSRLLPGRPENHCKNRYNSHHLRVAKAAAGFKPYGKKAASPAGGATTLKSAFCKNALAAGSPEKSNHSFRLGEEGMDGMMEVENVNGGVETEDDDDEERRGSGSEPGGTQRFAGTDDDDDEDDDGDGDDASYAKRTLTVGVVATTASGGTQHKRLKMTDDVERQDAGSRSICEENAETQRHAQRTNHNSSDGAGGADRKGDAVKWNGTGVGNGSWSLRHTSGGQAQSELPQEIIDYLRGVEKGMNERGAALDDREALIEQTERGLLERRGLLMDWEKEVSGREAAVKEKERQLMQVEALLIEKNGLLEDLASRDEGNGRQLKEKERQLMQIEALLIEKNGLLGLLIEKNGLLEDLASRDEGTVAKEPGVRKELV